MKIFIPFFSLLLTGYLLYAQPRHTERHIRGRVTDSAGNALAGASITAMGYSVGTVTDGHGGFSFTVPENTTSILVRYVGFESKAVRLGRDTLFYQVTLRSQATGIAEVTISSGYQNLSRSQTTGSYSDVGKTLLEREVTTDITDRLDGITPSLAFDNRAPDAQNLSVRGRSTILSDNAPLIVVDNFPYDGDLHNINPNDVDHITVLKDAAAAAIWGARAGNGVIVITTKKGRYNTPARASFNASATVLAKPDLFYSPNFLASSEFIDVEKQLFSQGFYTASLTDANKPVVSPVVEILSQMQNGTLSAAAGNSQIDALRQNDVRHDFDRYFYRTGLNQQYNFNITGGSTNYNYYLSGGYDRNQSNLVGNSDDRYTINVVNTVKPLTKLTINSNIIYTAVHSKTNNPGIAGITSGPTYIGLYPYARLTTDSGAPAAVAKDYPLSFSSAAQSQGYQDWQYRPLQELQTADNRSVGNDIRISLNGQYQLLTDLSAEFLYQYQHSSRTANGYNSGQSYFTRNLINEYQQPGQQYAIPLGGILNKTVADLDSQSGRVQLNYNTVYGGAHFINAIAGTEVRNSGTQSNTNRLYGYDPDLLLNQPVNYQTYYTLNPGTNSARIPYLTNLKTLHDRYVSAYLNANYNYAGKYYLSASARKDASNLFGVNTNQRWVPLYSLGAGWQLSNERFYHLPAVPYLKLRATYGYTGNVNKSLTAYTTAAYMTDAITRLPSALILTPPDPDLRWEKVRTINLAADFELVGKRLTGSLDYYTKKGSDLIGAIALDPTTGFFVGGRYSTQLNSSSLSGHGLDIELNSLNTTGKLQWKTRLLFSYVTDKVLSYDGQNPVSNFFSPDSPPTVGRPVFGVYSYRWAGLDPVNGDPQVYLKGAPSKDYAAIAASATLADLVYNGPALPPVFGSVMNSFTYRRLSLSFNLAYKFGYYFHRPSISYSALISNWQGNQDFSKRWQSPGDEKRTNVPSLSLSGNANRDLAYINSDILVDKGDNIRFKDLQVSYTFDPFRKSASLFKSLTVYAYATNIRLLWTANKDHLDPDYLFGNSILKPVKTISLGLRSNL